MRFLCLLRGMARFWIQGVEGCLMERVFGLGKGLRIGL